MARLPDVTALGQSPTPRPSRSLPQPRGVGNEAAKVLERSGLAEAASMAEAGGALADVSAALFSVEQKVQTRRDAVGRARAVSAFTQEAEAELLRLQTEGDFTDIGAGQQYAGFLRERQSAILGGHGGSADSQASLETRLEGIRQTYVSQAARIGRSAQDAMLAETFGSSLNTMVAAARQNPATLPDLFQSMDAQIDDMMPALTPEQEMAFASSGREQLAMAALDGLLDRGAFKEAKEIIATTPGLVRHLSPGSQEQIMGRITAFEEAEDEALTAGLRERERLTAFLRREPTPAELARAAGVAPPTNSALSPSQKIAQAEAALDRKLSPSEREQIIGLEPATPQSKAGKIVQDRQNFVDAYGENSEQVRAFDQAAAAGDGPPKISDISGLRKEYTKLSQPFIDARVNFEKIESAAESGTAAGDVAMIFSFMKVLDPGSTVREGEFATAEQTGGVPQRVVTLYNRLLEGERLSPEQRQGFLEQAEGLFTVHRNAQVRLEEQFGQIAVSQGMDPSQVIVDFRGDGTPAQEIQETQEAPSAPTILQFNLQGNPISGEAPEAAPSGETAPAVPDAGEGVEAIEGATGDDVLGDNARQFIANLPPEMVNARMNKELARRLQEALNDLGVETPMDGKYRRALRDAFLKARGGAS